MPTLDDLPTNKASCANCTRKGGICPREKKTKTQHNGLIYNFANECVGIISCCQHYTGPFQTNILNLFDFD